MLVKVFMSIMLVLLLGFGGGFTVYGATTTDRDREGRIALGLCTFILTAAITCYIICEGILL